MALNFNPFENDHSLKAPSIKKKITKLKPWQEPPSPTGEQAVSPANRPANEGELQTLAKPLPPSDFQDTKEQPHNIDRTSNEQPHNNTISNGMISETIFVLTPLNSANDRTKQQLHNNETTTTQQRHNVRENASKEHRHNNHITTEQHQSNIDTTTREQPNNNAVTANKHPANKPKNNRHNKPHNNLTNGHALETQAKNKTDDFNVFRIKGHKRKILTIVYRRTSPDCNFVSDPIDTEIFTSELQTTSGSVNTVIGRLWKEDNYFEVIDSYCSPCGGWRIFRMPEPIYRVLDRADAAGHLDEVEGQTTEQPHNKPQNNRHNKPQNNSINEPSSSSSSLSLESIDTTSTEPKETDPSQKFELPQEWLEINFSNLTRLAFPFGRPQLKQWYERKYCDAKAAQESINHFAFQLERSKKEDFRTGPMNYFMGIMASSHYFNAPEGYISPEEDARLKRLQNKRAEQERRQQQEEQYFDLVFEEYFSCLNSKQIFALSDGRSHVTAQKSVIRHKLYERYAVEIREAFQKGESVDVHTLALEGKAIEEAVLPPLLAPNQTKAPSSQLGEGTVNSQPNVPSPNAVTGDGTEVTGLKSRIKTTEEMIRQFTSFSHTTPVPGVEEKVQKYQQTLSELKAQLEKLEPSKTHGSELDPEEIRKILDAQFGTVGNA